MTIDTGAVRTVPKLVSLREQVPVRGRRKSIRVKPGRLFLAAFALWATVTFCVQQVAIWQEMHSLRDVQQQVEQVKESNQLLQGDIARMQSKEYIEQVARERLGLTKPGEIMYVPATTSSPQGNSAPGPSIPAAPGR